MENNVAAIRTLRAKEAAKKLSIGLSTFWRWASNGKLPKGRKLSPRTTVWVESELDAFVDKAAGRSPE